MAKRSKKSLTAGIRRCDARRREIVAACRRIYETKSFQEVTVCDVSKLVNFSRPTIYNYFHTKEEIFLALFQQEFEHWSAELKKAVSTVRIPKPRRFAEIVADTLSRHKTLFKLLSMNVHDMEKGSRPERLVEFRRVFKKAYDALDASLAKFFPRASLQERKNFHAIFWPFLSGVYLYANPTDAQLESMETVGLPPIDKDERALIFDATSSLIASFEKSVP